MAITSTSVVHAFQGDHGWRYRIWSPVARRYLTRELTRDAMRDELLNGFTSSEINYGRADAEIEARLSCARKNGASETVAVEGEVRRPTATEEQALRALPCSRVDLLTRVGVSSETIGEIVTDGLADYEYDSARGTLYHLTDAGRAALAQVIA